MKFTTKHTTIDAVQYRLDDPSSHVGLDDRCTGTIHQRHGGLFLFGCRHHDVHWIGSMDGGVTIVSDGDWVVTDERGRRHVVKDEVFRQVYTVAEQEAA